ncbi:heavy-metal-associated domain-containing protein [Tenacibaculum sp. MEBiC06402]|uniref:heavy-metal-associated domain-containing protein n=1 Tax=unclassified Tenacibaculum TaxID=2635139 RepID=UPI003B98E951
MKITLEIQNLKCGGCEKTITDNLLKIEGIDEVNIHHENSSITLDYSNENSVQKAIEKLSKLGYPISGDENSLGKKATSYVSCMIGKIKS